MIRASYYPGADVWQHPRAEACFNALNRMRVNVYDTTPLLREKASTEDVIRERLWEGDKWDREARRLKRKREAASAEADA